MRLIEKLRIAGEMCSLYGIITTGMFIVRKLVGIGTENRYNFLFRSGGNALDKKLGVHTDAYITKNKSDLPEAFFSDAEPYLPVHPRIFNAAIKATDINHPEYTFIDIGSGLGRAVILANKYSFKKIVGIELSKQLNDQAIKNLNAYSVSFGEFQHQLLNINALDYNLPNDNLCIHINRPFSPAVMVSFLKNIEKSLQEYPRNIVIVSVYLYELNVF